MLIQELLNLFSSDLFGFHTVFGLSSFRSNFQIVAQWSHGFNLLLFLVLKKFHMKHQFQEMVIF